MKDRLHTWQQLQRHHCLSNPVGDSGDGDFILPLLQSRVGIFLSVWSCAGRLSLNGMVSGGTDILWWVRLKRGVWCAGLRG